MNSLEKIKALLAGELDVFGELTEEGARNLGMLRMLAPVLKRQLPDDPAELDVLLVRVAEFMVSFRSDDAEELYAVSVIEVQEAELVEGPAS